MPQKELPANNSPEEIDLLAFIQKTANWFISGISSILKLVVKLVFYAFRKWYLLTATALLGVMISYGFSRLAGRSYESEMIIRSNAVAVSEVTSYINRLSVIIKQRNYNALDTILNLNRDKVRNLKKIETFRVIDLMTDGHSDYIDYDGSFIKNDTVDSMMEDRFVLRVTLKEVDDLGEYSNSLISYIEQNKLFKELNDFRKDQQLSNLTRVEFDIKQIDSLQKVKYFEETRNISKTGNGQLLLLQDNKTQLLISEMQMLFDRREIIERELTVFPGVCSVIEDFTPILKSSTGTLYYGTYIVPTLLILVLILSLFRENRDSINRWVNQ